MTSATQSFMNQIVSAIRNGMNNSVAAIRNGGSQMVSSFRSTGTQIVSTAQSMVNQAVSAIRSGYGGMQSAGAYIGQGVAAGMRSALGSVTSAANAIIAKANEAARAAAKIHSPSRLFRDEVGYWIGAGIAVGIERTDGMVEKSLNYIQNLASSLSSKTASILQDDLNFSNLEGRLLNTMSIDHTPQNVQHNIDNVASQQSLLGKLEEILVETRKGHAIYMDGREVGNLIDQRLGQNTSQGGRFAW